MISILCGNEPYLIDCQKLSLIGKLALPELNLMETSSIQEDVFLFLRTIPITDRRKVVFVDLDNLSELDCPLFHAYKKKPSPHGCLIVRARNYDARKVLYKELKKEGYIQVLDKDMVALSEFIQKRLVKKGASFDCSKTLELFMEHENYANREDITLYNILSDLNNLISLGNPITAEMVKSVVPLHEKDNMFGLAKLIQKKDIAGLRNQAELLRGAEIGTLGALLREYRIAYKAHFCSLQQIGVNRNMFPSMERDALVSSIMLITNNIDAAKKGKIPMSIVLEHTFLQLIRSI